MSGEYCDSCGRYIPIDATHICPGPRSTTVPATNAPRSISELRIHHPGTSCRARNQHGQCGCPWGKCAQGFDGVLGTPAHSKSEYKRRVAQGDANVLPPASGVQEVPKC